MTQELKRLKIEAAERAIANGSRNLQEVAKAVVEAIDAVAKETKSLPVFFNDILRKLEFSAEQSALWENCEEDASIAAIEYRACAIKLKKWMEEQSK